jgi:hypothetical protein
MSLALSRTSSCRLRRLMRAAGGHQPQPQWRAPLDLKIDLSAISTVVTGPGITVGSVNAAKGSSTNSPRDPDFGHFQTQPL